MLNLVVSIVLLVVQDSVVGSYSIPEILPATATHLPYIHGDTLFEDGDGKKYVIHLPSGGKLYNPILYDSSLPFEIRWTPTGLVAINSLTVLAKIEMPSPQMPVLDVGTIDYVLYGPAGATWGLYYLNNQMVPNEQGYETVGVWPPSSKIQNYFSSHYNITDPATLTFQSTIRGGTSSPNSIVLKWKSLSTAPMKIRIDYAPITIDPTLRSWIHRHSEFVWAGQFDLNIDGVKNSEDEEQFLTWHLDQDSRSDWDQNGIVNEVDRILFQRAFNGEATDMGEEGPSAGASDGAVSGGCSLHAEAPLKTSLGFFALLMSIAIFFGRGIARQRDLRRKSPLAYRF